MDKISLVGDWQAMLEALAVLEIDALPLFAVVRHALDLLFTNDPPANRVKSETLSFSAGALSQHLHDQGFTGAAPGLASRWQSRWISREILRRSLSVDWVGAILGEERRNLAALRLDFFHPNADVTLTIISALRKVLLTQPDLLLANSHDANGPCALPEAEALDASVVKPVPLKRIAKLGEPGFWQDNAFRTSLDIDGDQSLTLALAALEHLPQLSMLQVNDLKPPELPVLMQAIADTPRLRALVLGALTMRIVDGQWYSDPVTEADCAALHAAWARCTHVKTLRMNWFPPGMLAAMLTSASHLKRLALQGKIDAANRERLLALHWEELFELDLSHAEVGVDFLRQLRPEHLPRLRRVGVMFGSGVESARDWNGADVAQVLALRSDRDVQSTFFADRPWIIHRWFSDHWIRANQEHD